MTTESGLLVTGREILHNMQNHTAGLDGTDESVWFIQGALASMFQHGESDDDQGAADKLGYAVYLADMLAATCKNVRALELGLEVEGNLQTEIVAIQEPKRSMQFTLAWVYKCAANPDADNIVFKFAGALADFGEHQRAQNIYHLLQS